MRILLCLGLSLIWGIAMHFLVPGLTGIGLSFAGGYGIAYITAPAKKTVEGIVQKDKE